MNIREFFRAKGALAADKAKSGFRCGLCGAKEKAGDAKVKLKELALEAESLAKEADPVVAKLKKEACQRGRAVQEEATLEFIEISKKARKKAAKLEKKARKLEKKMRKIEKQQKKQLKKLTKKSRRK